MLCANRIMQKSAVKILWSSSKSKWITILSWFHRVISRWSPLKKQRFLGFCRRDARTTTSTVESGAEEMGRAKQSTYNLYLADKKQVTSQKFTTIAIWKDPPFLIGKPLFQWAISHGNVTGIADIKPPVFCFTKSKIVNCHRSAEVERCGKKHRASLMDFQWYHLVMTNSLPWEMAHL